MRFGSPFQQETLLKATAVRSPEQRRLCRHFFLGHQFFLVLLFFYQSCCPERGVWLQGGVAMGRGRGWGRGGGLGEGAGDISIQLPCTALPQGASP